MSDWVKYSVVLIFAVTWLEILGCDERIWNEQQRRRLGTAASEDGEDGGKLVIGRD